MYDIPVHQAPALVAHAADEVHVVLDAHIRRGDVEVHCFCDMGHHLGVFCPEKPGGTLSLVAGEFVRHPGVVHTGDDHARDGVCVDVIIRVGDPGVRFIKCQWAQ